ncbi:DDB1- and CUL4-associated factor 8 isoform X2 [Diachasmimorpha longicaudata]|uniref:DDB1- and CUL4-associated factor 8 isoform X2 n=1 Tax=Diachasmimorpha longicaudata TaxID=58733 RepID=UPI0030B90493
MENGEEVPKVGGSGHNKVSGCDEATEMFSENEGDMEGSEDKCKEHDEVMPMERDNTALEAGGMNEENLPENSVKLKSPGQRGQSLEESLNEDETVVSKRSPSDPQGLPKSKNEGESSDNDSDRVENPQGSSDTSGIAESSQPSCSTSKFHKLKSKVKKRHYRKKSSDTEDARMEEKKLRANDDDTSPSSSGEHERTKRSSEEHREERIQSLSDDQNTNSNSDHEGDDSSEWTTASEDEISGEVPRVLQKNPPKPRMFIVPEVINRQIGNTRLFERKFYGSLHVVQRLELMQKMEEHDGCVNALNFNREGNLLASASDDLRVVIWDWAIGKKRHAFHTGHKSNVFESKWLPLDFENYVATCARDGQVRLLNICSGSHRKLASHHGPARRLGIHPDHPHTILSVGDDAKIIHIDIRGGKPMKILTVKEGRSDMNLYSIHINPRNSREFCVGGRSQAVKIYDRRKLSSPLQRLCPEHLSDNTCAHVTCAMYNYNGTEIIASYNDDDIYLFDVMVLHPSGDFAHRYEGHRNNATVKSVNFFGPKSEFIVSGSDCGNIFFWDKNTEAIVQWFPGDEQGVVNRLESHPNVPILATSGLDHDVKIWIPSCEQAPEMTKLGDCVKTNLRNRADDITMEPDAFDGQMLMVFLQHIRQHEGFSGLFSSRSGLLMWPFEADNSDSSSDAVSDHSEDSPSDGPTTGPQCSPS